MKTTMIKKRNNIQTEENNNIFQNLIDYTFVRIFNKYLRKKSHSPKLTAKLWIALFLAFNVSSVLFPIGLKPSEMNAYIIITITIFISLIYFSEKRIIPIKNRWDNILSPNQKSKYGWLSFFYIFISVILFICGLWVNSRLYG